MDEYTSDPATETEFLWAAPAHVNAARAPSAAGAHDASATQPASPFTSLVGRSPVAPPRAGYTRAKGVEHIGHAPRSRTLLIVLFPILAFTLGGLVSLRLFNRSVAASHLPLDAQRAAVAEPNLATQLSASPPTDAGVIESESLATNTARLKTTVLGRPTDVEAERRSTGAQARTRGAAIGAAGGRAARQSSAIKSESLSPAVRAQAVRQFNTSQSAMETSNPAGGACALSTSRSRLTLHSHGGAAEVAVSLGKPNGPAAVTASTNDWANVVVFAGARRGGVSLYRIVSVSQRPGTYSVTFSSPCGAKRIAVSVE